MAVYRILADIVEVLRTLHLDRESVRANMVTKRDLAALEAAMDKRLDSVDKRMIKLGLSLRHFATTPRSLSICCRS